MSTELTEVTKAVAEFDRVALGLASLREKYGSVVYDVATTAGMTDAKAARLAIREPRYEIERIRKAAKAPILALGKKLDSEAAQITGELEKLEAPIDGAIKAEEERKEREKNAAEQQRLAEERAEFERAQEQARKVKEAEERRRAEQARIANMRPPDRAELVEILMRHYNVPAYKVVEWMRAVDWSNTEAA